jgi:type I restriction enzyme S subunit
MAVSWLTVPLESVVRFQEGPGILAKDFHPSGVPLVRLAGLGGHQVTLDKCEYLDPNLVAGRWNHFKLKRGDILVSTSASFGRPAIVGEEAEGAIFYTGLIRFRSASPELDEGYLKTFLGSRAFMLQAEALASGSVISHFGPSHLRRMEIPLPPMSEQRNIARVHSALDDKIDLNRRMNETLEAMARAIFQDWFVTFGPTRAKQEDRPPYLAPDLWSLFPNRLDGDSMPEGWARMTLRELASVSGGQIRTGPFGSQLHQADYRPIGTPVVMPTNLTSGEIVEDGIARIDDDMAAKLADHAMIEGDIVYGRRGDIGRKALIGPDEAGWLCGTGCLRVSIRSDTCPPIYIFCHLDRPDVQEWISTRAIGATMPNLNTGILGSVEIVTPSASLARAFVQTVDPIVQRARANRREGKTLAATRDLLLPKLMSGELRVKDAERLAEAAL